MCVCMCVCVCVCVCVYVCVCVNWSLGSSFPPCGPSFLPRSGISLPPSISPSLLPSFPLLSSFLPSFVPSFPPSCTSPHLSSFPLFFLMQSPPPPPPPSNSYRSTVRRDYHILLQQVKGVGGRGRGESRREEK